jgi:hypothetical protein
MFRKTYFVNACVAAMMLSMPLGGMAEEAAGMPMTQEGPKAGMPTGQEEGGQPEQMPMTMEKKCMMRWEMRAKRQEMREQRQEMMQQHMQTMEQHLANIEALLKQLVELKKAK